MILLTLPSQKSIEIEPTYSIVSKIGILRRFIGITCPHPNVIFSSNIFIETSIVISEETCSLSLSDREFTHLGNRRFQRLFQVFTIGDVKVHNLDITGEDRKDSHDKRAIGIAVVELMMRMNRIPDNEDGEKTGMCRHETGVKSLYPWLSRQVNALLQF